MSFSHRSVFRRAALAALLFFAMTCMSADDPPPRRRSARPVSTNTLDDVQQRTFQWFWDTTNPRNGLVPDRWPTKSFSSVAAVGFGLVACGIGAERGYITRDQAKERTLTTLRFFWNAPQGDQPRGVTGYRGFFYHFIDMETGERFQTVELSSIDTSLFIAGALFSQSYFDRDDPGEREIRELAEKLYARIEWPFYQVHSPAITMSWKPEQKYGRAE